MWDSAMTRSSEGDGGRVGASSSVEVRKFACASVPSSEAKYLEKRWVPSEPIGACLCSANEPD